MKKLNDNTSTVAANIATVNSGSKHRQCCDLMVIELNFSTNQNLYRYEK